MFTMKRPLARNSAADPDDTAHVKFALTALGYYDDTETGLSPYGDDRLFQSVQSFQKDNDLQIDGVINPDGETQKTIKDHLAEKVPADTVFMDFKKNFYDMREADTDGADKYFHCKANYEATQRGWLGGATAYLLSNAKESRDKIKGGTMTDINQDQKANKYGRANARSGNYKSAREACAVFRPKGLDEKY